MKEALENCRNNIDRLDSQVLKLLNERAQWAQKVGEIKQAAGDISTMYRPEREAQVLRRLQHENQGPLKNETISFLFREIMSACLALEKPVSVAYLGPEGTFTQAAALKHFGHAVESVLCRSIDEIFRQVASGLVQYAVVPVENSTEGAVNRTLDLLVDTPLQICSEVFLRIHHNLLATQSDLTQIKRVYSHTQSLGQCHEWLARHLPHAEKISVLSNAEAAVRAKADPESAAIAGELAATHYGLTILHAHIEDEPNNTTRFLVLGEKEANPSGCDKTSLILSAKNRPGAMKDLLEPFSAYGVDMTKLESRPSPSHIGGMWEYIFFIDIEGHRTDANVAQALQKLKDQAAFIKVLGSYPKAPF